MTTTAKSPSTPFRIVTLLGIGVGISLLGDATMYVVLPTQYAVAGILATDVGIMLSANRAVRIFINTPYGMLIERIPRRRLLIPSMVVGGLASLLYVAGGFVPMLLGRMMWGIGWAGIWLGAMTMALDVATDTNRGQTIGRLQMWMFIGKGTSALLGGVLFDALGFAPTLLISAVGILTVALMWLFFLPETRDYRKTHEAQNLEQSEETALPHTNPDTHQKRAVANVSFPALVLTNVLYAVNWMLFVGVFTSVLPLLVQEQLGSGPAREQIFLFGLLVVPLLSFTGFLSSMNTVVSLISSPLSGWLTDRTGRRWDVVALGFMVALIAFVLSFAGEGVLIVLASLMVALTSGVLMTQLTALVGDYARQHAPLRQGRLLGIQNTLGDIGAAAGPLVAFGLIPHVGLSGLYQLGAIVIGLTIPAVLWVARRDRIRRRAHA